MTRIANKRAETIGAGEAILSPGTTEQLYLLKRGLVRIRTVDGAGSGLTLRYVKPGGYFGEEAILGHRRHYIAEAVTECAFERLNPARLGTNGQKDLLRYYVGAIETLYGSLQRQSGKRLKARLAAELLELQDSALAQLGKRGQPTIRITHDDLAMAVGSVRETVTKVVGEITRSGAISAGYGKITLLNIALLEQLANE